jgi:pyruvate/2-oxoglutarate dehydrogenase complex dihydrolipoamide acyltransferase (E2) component
MRWTWLVAAVLMACGGNEAEAPEAEAPEQAAAEAEAPAPEAEAAEEAAPAAPATPAPDGARVFFVSPSDGDTVTSPLHIVMGVEGIAIKPAGAVETGSGHHHIIIGPAGIPEGQVVPADETHIHFGKGQTEADVELEPGEHKLTLQFANGAHTSYGEVLASTITVTVE